MANRFWQMVAHVCKRPVVRWGVLGILACGPALAPAAQVSISPSANTVSVGDVFAIRFRIEGFSSASGDSLSAFDISLSYDNLAVQWVGFAFGDAASGSNQLDLFEPSSFGFLGDAVDTTGASVNAFGLSGNSTAVLDASQAGDFDFLTLSFRAVAASGTALFSVNPGNPNLLFVDSGASGLPVSYGALDASVVIGSAAAVAEPGSLYLALMALAALFALPRGWGQARRGIGVLAAVASLATSAWAAEPARAPAVAAPSPAPAAAPARALVSGTVTQVQGQRLRVKADGGNLAWFTTSAPLTAGHVGRRVRGESRPVGDTQLIDKPIFD